MKPKKHIAPQLPLAIDPPLTLQIGRIILKDDTARLWRAYSNAQAHLDPGTAQLARALIRLGLETWNKGLTP